MKFSASRNICSPPPAVPERVKGRCTALYELRLSSSTSGMALHCAKWMWKQRARAIVRASLPTDEAGARCYRGTYTHPGATGRRRTAARRSRCGGCAHSGCRALTAGPRLALALTVWVWRVELFDPISWSLPTDHGDGPGSRQRANGRLPGAREANSTRPRVAPRIGPRGRRRQLSS